MPKSFGSVGELATALRGQISSALRNRAFALELRHPWGQSRQS